MQKKHGAEFTKTIVRRLAEMRAMPCFSEYLKAGIGKPHSLKADFEGCYGVSVKGNTRIILEPVCEVLSGESLGKCEEVILKGVVDYHGQKKEWIIP